MTQIFIRNENTDIGFSMIEDALLRIKMLDEFLEEETSLGELIVALNEIQATVIEVLETCTEAIEHLQQGLSEPPKPPLSRVDEMLAFMNFNGFDTEKIDETTYKITEQKTA